MSEITSKFIGRENELKILKKVYATDCYEGIIVYGRRRIGKSELIKHSFIGQNCRIIYFECTKVAEESNTAAFAETLGRNYGIPTPAFTSFSAALDYVFMRSVEEKTILVIDEYPYLREKITECDSQLQKIIDTYAMNCKMKFILCGSFVDVMTGLLSENNPLNRRLSTRIHVKQMDYYESAKFYSNFSNEDKVKIYSVFGGLPYYNHFVDDGKRVEENILELVASPNARFNGDVESTLEKEIARMTNANEVFLAIAKGYHKFKDILAHCKVSSSPTLADILNRLVLMDIVRREVPINDESEKKTIYSISDRMTHFYYRYIFSKKSYFSTMPPEEFYGEFIEQDFNTQYVPREFEEIAKQYLLRENLANKIKPPLYKIGKYYYDDSVNKTNGEFDVVTLSRNGYDFYEVKFTAKPVDDSVAREESKQIFSLKIPCHKQGFVSKSGFALSEPEKYILIDIKQMFK